jgi:hypothetical protein
MNNYKLPISGYLFILLLAACASSAGSTTTSGVEGQVLIGPMCPVVQVGLPCPDKPYEATIHVLDQNGKPVTAVKSDAQGNFKVGLPPGTYTLSPAAANGLTRAPEQTVTVIAGQFTPITISYDSGIR